MTTSDSATRAVTEDPGSGPGGQVTPRSGGGILSLSAIGHSKRKLKTTILAPMLYLPIAAFSYLLYVRGVKDPSQREINRRLFRLMTSADCLMNENIVMRFHKNL